MCCHYCHYTNKLLRGTQTDYKSYYYYIKEIETYKNILSSKEIFKLLQNKNRSFSYFYIIKCKGVTLQIFYRRLNVQTLLFIIIKLYSRSYNINTDFLIAAPSLMAFHATKRAFIFFEKKKQQPGD